MKYIYCRIENYKGMQEYQVIIIGTSFDAEIEYYNDDLVNVKINNIQAKHSDLIGKVVQIKLTNNNPIEGNLIGVIEREAALIYFNQ